MSVERAPNAPSVWQQAINVGKSTVAMLTMTNFLAAAIPNRANGMPAQSDPPSRLQIAEQNLEHQIESNLKRETFINYVEVVPQQGTPIYNPVEMTVGNQKFLFEVKVGKPAKNKFGADVQVFNVAKPYFFRYTQQPHQATETKAKLGNQGYYAQANVNGVPTPVGQDEAIANDPGLCAACE